MAYSMHRGAHRQNSHFHRGVVPLKPNKHLLPYSISSPSSSQEEPYDLTEIRMGPLYDLTESYIGKNPSYFSVHNTWHFFREPRFSRFWSFEDTNTLHFYALDDAPLSQDERSQGRVGKVRKRPGVENEGSVGKEWIMKYRSEGYQSVVTYWSRGLQCARARGADPGARGHTTDRSE